MRTTEMKKWAGRAGIATAFALAGMLGASAALAGIAATRHNLSTSGNIANVRVTAGTAEICVFCHTPHNALKNAAGTGGKNTLPLWNHTVSATATYGTYGSITMNATPAELGAATNTNTATSHLCLSCHDGTVAINSFNRVSTINPTTNMTGAGIGGTIGSRSSNLGTDLSNDHPINFTYDTALTTADGGLVAPGSLVGVKLFDNKVQCASCHDPHTSKDTSGKGLVRVSMNSSALCTSCHIK